MRKVIVLLGFALLFVAPRAQAQAPLATNFQAREAAILDAVKAKQYETVRAALDSTFTSVYNDGVHDLAGDMEDTKSVTLGRYELRDFKARQMDAATVLVTYKVTIDASASGKDVSGSYWASSLWRRKGNHWRVLLHTEAKAS